MREAEVVALIAEGFTIEEVGKRLSISRWTVKSHVKHMVDRCGARNITHLAVRYARGELRVVDMRAGARERTSP